MKRSHCKFTFYASAHFLIGEILCIVDFGANFMVKKKKTKNDIYTIAKDVVIYQAIITKRKQTEPFFIRLVKLYTEWINRCDDKLMNAYCVST